MAQVASAEIEVAEEISQVLTSIVEQIGRYETAARLFAANSRVTDAIARVFAQILRYLVRAKLHYSKGKLLRAKEAAFSNKFAGILCELRECALDLDREIGTAVAESQSRLVWRSRPPSLCASQYYSTISKVSFPPQYRVALEFWNGV